MGNREGIVLSLVKTMRVEWHLVRSDAFGLACGQNGFYQRATCVCVCVYTGCDVCVCVCGEDFRLIAVASIVLCGCIKRATKIIAKDNGAGSRIKRLMPDAAYAAHTQCAYGLACRIP